MGNNEEYTKFLKKLLKLVDDNTDNICKLNETNVRLQKHDILAEIDKINISNKFGFDLVDRGNTCYTPKGFTNLEYYIILAHYDGIYREVNNISPLTQPSDEWLLNVHFPTGAYFLVDGGCFDKPYLSDLFNKMIDEFLALKPKYVDKLNKSMYFTSDNAKNVLDTWYAITGKYKDIVEDELKKIKIKELEVQLNELKREENT